MAWTSPTSNVIKQMNAEAAAAMPYRGEVIRFLLDNRNKFLSSYQWYREVGRAMPDVVKFNDEQPYLTELDLSEILEELRTNPSNLFMYNNSETVRNRAIERICNEATLPGAAAALLMLQTEFNDFKRDVSITHALKATVKRWNAKICLTATHVKAYFSN
jgi:hypothetical protein